jgi:hypothetical protein
MNRATDPFRRLLEPDQDSSADHQRNDERYESCPENWVFEYFEIAMHESYLPRKAA